jgi:hypothetical protein
MKNARPIRVLLLGAVVAATLTALLALDGGPPLHTPAGGPVQAAGLRLAIDADATNGICTTVDSEVTVTVGQSYQIAVCVESLPQEMNAVDIDIFYDDTLSQVPDLPNAVPALDDNPDANAGATTFSSLNLGPGWDCSGYASYFPVGDQDPASGPGKGDAFITCDHFYGDTMYLAGHSLPLAVIQVEALAPGADSFVFGHLVRLVGESKTFGLCDPGSAWAIPCDGATVTILAAPTATPTPTRTPSPAPTPSPTPTRSPTATPVPPPDADGGGAPDFLELAVGGNLQDPSDDAAILAADSDADGCSNSEELAGALAPAPGSTGAYDPLAHYDFYDVPVPAYTDPVPNGTRNRTVNVQDVVGVLKYVGTSDNGPSNGRVDYDSDKNGDTVEDGVDYDRSPSPPPNPPYQAGPPNGAVNLQDVVTVAKQVGLGCSGPG